MRTTPQFIRFPGGKAKLAATGIIGRRLGDITGELRVPFAGSLGDGLDLLRNGHLGPHAKVWINDINPNIANMWQVILGQPEDLCDRVREVVPSKLLFHEWKRSLLDASVSLDPVERAVRVVGVHRMSHSGRGTKGGALGNIGSRWNAARVCEGIEEAHGLLKGRTRVSCQDFGALLEAPGRDVALYLDPPYVVAGDGLYEFPFKPEDHRRLAAALATTPHRWLLSYDDHPVVRGLYADCRIEQVNVNSATHRTQGELLIRPPVCRRGRPRRDALDTAREVRDCLVRGQWHGHPTAWRRWGAWTADGSLADRLAALDYGAEAKSA